MTRWLVIVGLVLSGGGVASASGEDATGTMQQPTQQQDAQRMKMTMLVPSGATLVGAASATEVRTFPELGKHKTAGEEVVGAGAMDRVYESNKSYKTTVGYYDKMVKDGKAEQMARTVTRTATGWTLKLPDGSVQNIVVRNTRPTTIEMVEAAGAVGETPAPSGMKKEATPGGGSQGTMPGGSQGTTPGGGSQGTMPGGSQGTMPGGSQGTMPPPSRPSPGEAAPQGTMPPSGATPSPGTSAPGGGGDQ